jgi:asparagine synthetase B (glutamine-hydrolysing)
MQARRYWVPTPTPAQGYALSDLEEMRQRFNANVGRAVAVGGPFSLALTGGIDARLVLSALIAAGIRPHTMIHSVPGSSDAIVSAELARVAGAEHHFFEVRGEDLPDQFRPGIRLLGGQVARPDVHPLCFLDDLKRFTHVMFTGHGGDLPRREYAATRIDPQRHTRADVAQALFAYYNRYNTMLSVSRDFPVLLSPDWLPTLQNQPARSIEEAMADVPPTIPLDDVGLVVEVQEYLPKYWAKGDLMVRRELETRHPLVDRAFLERTWNLPKTARAEAVVHRYILSRNAPALAGVPYERDNLPVRYPFNRRDRWRLSLARWQATLHARLGHPYLRIANYHYAEWIRGPLRPLFSDLLLDPRTLGRPYLRGETVRRWYDEHIAGQDHATRLMVLLNLELTVRMLIENDVS